MCIYISIYTDCIIVSTICMYVYIYIPSLHLRTLSGLIGLRIEEARFLSSGFLKRGSS